MPDATLQRCAEGEGQKWAAQLSSRETPLLMLIFLRNPKYISKEIPTKRHIKPSNRIRREELPVRIREGDESELFCVVHDQIFRQSAQVDHDQGSSRQKLHWEEEGGGISEGGVFLLFFAPSFSKQTKLCKP